MDAGPIVAELRSLQETQASLMAQMVALQGRQLELLAQLAGNEIPVGIAYDESSEDSATAIIPRGVELGEKVMLDEDVYAETPAHKPPRVYVFEEYDSEAPADSNCTLVDVATDAWTVRGIGELVPVDDEAAG